MAESVQKEMDRIKNAINALEKALPLIVTPSKHEDGLQHVIEAADHIKEISVDEDFKSLSTNIKILTNGESLILGDVCYQQFIVDILEELTDIRNNESLQNSNMSKLVSVGEYLIRLAGRVTNRFKIKVLFEEEYEAKSLRAFMVLKELSSVVRFLNVSPDISENQDANLENGLEIDVLSQSDPDELHKIAGSVLEVQNVQIFRETRPQPVLMLDPPEQPDSFDNKIEEFIAK